MKKLIIFTPTGEELTYKVFNAAEALELIQDCHSTWGGRRLPSFCLYDEAGNDISEDVIEELNYQNLL